MFLYQVKSNNFLSNEMNFDQEYLFRLKDRFIMIYPPNESVNDMEQKMAYDEIAQHFESYFGAPPCFFARAPGRVNLIGEHIDYCGFAVLPMAIEQDIVMAIKMNDKHVLNLVNFNSEKYKKFSTSVEELQIDTTSPQWYHYFLCGYKGIIEQYKPERDQMGMDILVKGTVPPSSGLSSSSALVCASALATSFAYRISLTKMELASVCAVSERYIGTQGGGMDQAICFLAESGTAKLIEFNPLKTSNVPLPTGVVFVVSNSCVAMNKAATSQFNIRVVECRLAAKVLAKKHGFKWQNVQKLSEIPILLQKDISDMKAVIELDLPQISYTKNELCSILGISDDEFVTMLSENTRLLKNFQLSNRATHVFEEAARVQKFKLVCESGNNDIHELGRLMNESHQSCRDLYECSHPVLDELVKISLEAGAIGSRLTGAGWGGCCISLVMENYVEQFMNVLKKKFYERRSKECPGIDVNSAMFVTKPSGGAALYTLKL
ncbi:n-acetylgalactosamine kinase [Nephila pilipes]|uniref:N-acetylgalactosamine kinase n=1 Tax=Nephila pilipes TaxID=299642 RepID=A0A8X6R4A4_NEPPI|nr:n-acetylgalactosamine kinase [Nephila pilipes]